MTHVMWTPTKENMTSLRERLEQGCSKLQDEPYNQYDTKEECLKKLNHLAGGKPISQKMYILGRERVLSKEGRAWMLTYQKKKITLTEARELERQQSQKKKAQSQMKSKTTKHKASRKSNKQQT